MTSIENIKENDQVINIKIVSILYKLYNIDTIDII